MAYKNAGQLQLALPLFQEAAEEVEKKRLQHRYAGQIINNLASCYEKLGQNDQAATWRRKWQAATKGPGDADPARVGSAQPRTEPFVILPRNGRAEQKRATLARPSGSRDGETIEVRGNGPLPVGCPRHQPAGTLHPDRARVSAGLPGRAAEQVCQHPDEAD